MSNWGVAEHGDNNNRFELGDPHAAIARAGKTNWWTVWDGGFNR